VEMDIYGCVYLRCAWMWTDGSWEKREERGGGGRGDDHVVGAGDGVGRRSMLGGAGPALMN
jgi:hypothetical protein